MALVVEKLKTYIQAYELCPQHVEPEELKHQKAKRLKGIVDGQQTSKRYPRLEPKKKKKKMHDP